MIKKLTAELSAAGDVTLARHHQKFFKTALGEYGEGDLFLGLKVPQVREITRKYFKSATTGELEELLQSPYHEVRLAALIIMLAQFAAGDSDKKSQLFGLYVRQIEHINNWDLVDISAGALVGSFVFPQTDFLWELAKSSNLWKERIAVIATSYFIGRGSYEPTLQLAEHFLEHEHDLMHKACGWMLREIGKKDLTSLRGFLDRYSGMMPRTMLRYAIEKLNQDERCRYMAQKNLTW